MKVRCVDNRGQSDRLTVGKIYEIKKLNSLENPGVNIVEDDKGEDTYWFSTRFVAVEEIRISPMHYMNDSASRKNMPVYRGFVRYFPAAMALAALLSKKGNDKHNPGEEMHHNRSKSGDEGDCIIRHQMEVGTIDPDTDLDHAVGVFWRAAAQLQKLAEEKYGWPKAPGAK